MPGVLPSCFCYCSFGSLFCVIKKNLYILLVILLKVFLQCCAIGLFSVPKYKKAMACLLLDTELCHEFKVSE